MVTFAVRIHGARRMTTLALVTTSHWHVAEGSQESSVNRYFVAKRVLAQHILYTSLIQTSFPAVLLLLLLLLYCSHWSSSSCRCFLSHCGQHYCHPPRKEPRWSWPLPPRHRAILLHFLLLCRRRHRGMYICCASQAEPYVPSSSAHDAKSLATFVPVQKVFQVIQSRGRL